MKTVSRHRRVRSPFRGIFSTLTPTHRLTFASMTSSLMFTPVFTRTSKMSSFNAVCLPHSWATHLHQALLSSVWEIDLWVAEKGWKATSQALLLGEFQTKPLKTTSVWYFLGSWKNLQFNPQSSHVNWGFIQFTQVVARSGLVECPALLPKWLKAQLWGSISHTFWV